MTEDEPLMCLSCGAEPALPGAMLCARCCAEPAPEPAPDTRQPGLFEVAA
jgi:hypothetical protein